MRARVYERRSDLAPDGSLFVAFVRSSGGPASAHNAANANRDTWVAVSRPPWFTALALWFVGGTYCAGGSFPENRSLWLGFDPTPPDRGALPPWLNASPSIEGYVDRTPHWSERTVWFNRLLRNGWERIEATTPETWRRHSPHGMDTLRMTLRADDDFTAYGGPHIVNYSVVGTGDDEAHLGRVDGADWDQRGRLILAQGGQLVEWDAPGRSRLIEDFNDQTPETFSAPAWALRWPAW